MATPLNGSIIKGFEILSLFTEQLQQIDSALVAENLQMNNATAHRLLTTLEQVGALRSVRRGTFALGPKIERLGWLAEEANSIAAVVTPKLEALSGQLNESVMACRLSRHGPTCIAVANSRRAISVHVEVGTLLPLYRSAQGKLWLAQMSEAERSKRLSALAISDKDAVTHKQMDDELQRIQRQGFAVNLGENEPDIAAISMPLKNEDDQMELSISIFGMLSRFDPKFVDHARKHLEATIAHLQTEI
ncbi:MAG: helix-turn-helix domain-containing protein [Rhizobiaceae bacterium]|nr:helix-turn-helix domain-containing protein [Rhizobiaceae bacterium]